MRSLLEWQADRIESVLEFHGVPGRVTGGTVTPRWIRYRVLPAIGARIQAIKGLGEELAAALEAPGCRVNRRGAAVAIEVPRDDPLPVRLLSVYRQLCDEAGGGIPPLTPILGLAEDGAPLLTRLPSPDVGHVLAAGGVEAGKTVLLQGMALSLALANPGSEMGLVLCDGGNGSFGCFEGLPHLVRPIAQRAGEGTEVLRSLARMVDGRSPGDGRPPVVALIDDLVVGEEWESLAKVTRHGCEAGVHVVAATREPTAELAALFPVRLVGRVGSAAQARAATGWSGTGAEQLMGRGDFVAVAEGRVARFQAGHVSPEEVREVTAYLVRGKEA